MALGHIASCQCGECMDGRRTGSGGFGGLRIEVNDTPPVVSAHPAGSAHSVAPHRRAMLHHSGWHLVNGRFVRGPVESQRPTTEGERPVATSTPPRGAPLPPPGASPFLSVGEGSPFRSVVEGAPLGDVEFWVLRILSPANDRPGAIALTLDPAADAIVVNGDWCVPECCYRDELSAIQAAASLTTADRNYKVTMVASLGVAPIRAG